MLNSLTALVNLITTDFWGCGWSHLCCYPQAVLSTFHLGVCVPRDFIPRFCLFLQQRDWVWAFILAAPCTVRLRTNLPPKLYSIQAPETLH